MSRCLLNLYKFTAHSLVEGRVKNYCTRIIYLFIMTTCCIARRPRHPVNPICAS